MFKVKVCSICGKEFQPTSGVQKVCAECKPAYKKAQMHKYYEAHYEQKGSYKWEMPKGKASPSYKDGIGVFTKIAFDAYPPYCNRCKSTVHLCVHHKDRNRHNNDVANLEILCKSCHQKEHEAAKHLQESDVATRTREAARAYQLAHPKERDAKGRFTTKKA